MVVAGAGVGAEPGAHDAGVVAGLGQGDAQGVGELCRGGAVRAGGDVGQDLGHVGFAVDQGRAAGAGSNRSEEGEPGEGAVVGEPGGDVGVQVRVGIVYRVADGVGDLGGEVGQVRCGGGGGVQVLLIGRVPRQAPNQPPVTNVVAGYT